MAVPIEPAAADLETLQAVDDPAPLAPVPAETAAAPPQEQLNEVFFKLSLFSLLLAYSLLFIITASDRPRILALVYSV